MRKEIVNREFKKPPALKFTDFFCGTNGVEEHDLDFNKMKSPDRSDRVITPLASLLKSPKYYDDEESSLVIVGSLTKSITNAKSSSNKVLSDQLKL